MIWKPPSIQQSISRTLSSIPSRRNRNELRDSKTKRSYAHAHTHAQIYTLDIHLSLHYTQKNNQYNLTTLCVVKFKFLMNVVCLDTVAFLKENKKKTFFFRNQKRMFLILRVFLYSKFLFIYFFCVWKKQERLLRLCRKDGRIGEDKREMIICTVQRVLEMIKKRQAGKNLRTRLERADIDLFNRCAEMLVYIGTQLIDILSSIHQKRPFPSTRLIFSSGEQTKCVNSRQAEGREEGQQKHPEGVLRQLSRINLPSLARVFTPQIET